MPKFCLLPSEIDKIKQGLKNREIDPVKLSTMESSVIRNFLSQFVGKENATKVNAEFESKLMLKNWKRGAINWAKQLSGMKEPEQRSFINKVLKLDKILTESEQELFLEDFVAQRMGVRVTDEQSKEVFKLTKQIQDFKKPLIDNPNLLIRSDERMNYGRAKKYLANYVNNLKEQKEQANKLTLEDIKAEPIHRFIEVVSKIGGFSKSIKAAFDNSYIFKQGLKVMWTNPKIWAKNSRESFKHIVDTFKGKDIMNEVEADILSRPNAINGNYDKMKLAIGNIEEAYPSAVPENIPFIGKFYKASKDAFTGLAYQIRADLADKYLEIAVKSGVNIKDKFELRSIGKLVNSMTGRGNLGRFEKGADTVNNVFFAPKFLKSDIDTLTMHATDKMSKFARKQAAINLLKIISGTATIIAITNTLRPGTIELDPKSADFGKIRIGNTRFDITGGMSSIITLAARELTQLSKSSTSGKISKLGGEKFGSRIGMDVIYDFMENKLSPISSFIKNLLNRQDRHYNPITWYGETSNLLMPLPVSNFMESLKTPNGATPLITMIADGLGISTNTYSPTSGMNKEKKDKYLKSKIEQLGNKSATQEEKVYILKILESSGVTKSQANNLLDEHFKEQEKDLKKNDKGKYSKSHLKSKEEKEKRVKELLNDLGY